MLQDIYTSLCLRYTSDEPLILKSWKALEGAYSQENRYFHNLTHLEQLVKVLTPLKNTVMNWDALMFAVFYHDVAYDVVQYVLENDNEERSAVIAEEALRSMGILEEKIVLVNEHILATKTHRDTNNGDTNFFTDADLSILGQPWEAYHTYMKNIRKEYAIYPDTIYHAGRLKVLKNFLHMEQVYKTPHFYGLFESIARENMIREMEVLSVV